MTRTSSQILDEGRTLTRFDRDKGDGRMEALRSAVTRLRRKLGEDARKPRDIIGERGLGYCMPEADGQ